MMRVVIIVALLRASVLFAQDTSTGPEDPVIARAKQLVADGRATDGRRVLDSLLRVTSLESERYAEALYWRAALAATAAAAERDYRRLLIEAPLSARAEDALLQLAQLEQARGDRKAATDHLQRFMLSYAKSPARPRVSVWLVRLLFEQGPQQLSRACEALRSGRDEVPPDNAELRNQLEFYAPRCEGLAVASSDSQRTTPPAVAESTVTRDSARKESRPPPKAASRAARTSTKSTATPTAFYSVQVAAYDSKEPAQRLMQLLVSRGIDARVDGKVRPYRVRVGKYSTRAQAVSAAKTLKSQGHGGFVTLVKQ